MALGREPATPIPGVSTAGRRARGHFGRAAALSGADKALIIFKSDSFHLEDKIRKSAQFPGALLNQYNRHQAGKAQHKAEIKLERVPLGGLISAPHFRIGRDFCIIYQLQTI